MASNAGAKRSSAPSRQGQAQDADPEGPSAGQRPGPWPPRIEPLPADHGHNPKVLKSWALRTGYKSNVSGETAASSNSDIEISNADGSSQKRPSRMRPRDPQRVAVQPNVPKENSKSKASNVVDVDGSILAVPPPPMAVDRKASEPDQNVGAHQIRMEPYRGSKDSEADMLSQSHDADDVLLAKQSHMKYEIRENPGIGE